MVEAAHLAWILTSGFGRCSNLNILKGQIPYDIEKEGKAAVLNCSTVNLSPAFEEKPIK